ncbi:Pirin-like protein [Seminavis robusta]|uniref:Pirin-like protein n=1 Tax=Seminavis robusta TaxID=568900 RepID=A0A9N8EE15_9STRA|nr:Pirin-like protein [Seminavis robusta]|eukprot:Sro804_g204940.1 Pirin-like protein (407) ;mRNA; r:42115-43335
MHYIISVFIHVLLGVGLLLRPVLALQQSTPRWQPLPEVPRRQVLTSAVGAASAGLLLPAAKASPILAGPRSVIAVDSHLSIPVWPSWAGGRVVPVSLGGPLQDPFLLLAHHKHWFDPKDPLRQPFQQAGKLLGLPYVDVEGFKLHPHRGFDIWTYVLDGSDGFRHRDSLGESPRVYRGGSAQWMRTGSGVMHEEYWETRPDRRTNIELFQLWVNLGSKQKMDPPAIRYLGQDTTTLWTEKHTVSKGSGWVRDLTSTLNTVIDEPATSTDFDGQGMARGRPPLEILHVKLDPGSEFTWETTLNVVLYVREGAAQLKDVAGNMVPVEALQTATFSHNGDFVTIRNQKERQTLDFLLLSAQPLREQAIQAGPIVMNTEEEINVAYQQLQEGTFLNRDYVLKQHEQKRRA